MSKEEQTLHELKCSELTAILSGEKRDDPKYSHYYSKSFKYSTNAVVIKQVIINEDIVFPVDFGTDVEDIFIISGDFKGEFNINAREFAPSLRIEGGTFFKLFSLEGCTFKRSIVVDGATFLNDLVVFDGVFDRFEIEKGVFEDHFRILGGTFKNNFSIKDGIFTKKFIVEGGEFVDTFSIHSGNFSGGFEIENGTFKKNVWIEGGRFEKMFSLSGGVFDRVFMLSSNELYIENLEFSFKQNPVKLVKLSNKEDKFTIISLAFTDTILAKDAFVQLENRPAGK